MTEPLYDYRCKKCGDLVIPETHHKMTMCSCGAIMVDHGWYGSRVLWNRHFDDCVERVARVTEPTEAAGVTCD